jgi:hypothetical protein
MGIEQLTEQFGLTDEAAETAICEHVRLCYDVCHAAVSYEQPVDVLDKLKKYGLRVGKVQISAALKADFPADNATERTAVNETFARFNEPTYLHQVVARTTDNQLLRFADLPDALSAFDDTHAEWRAHFHVPLFADGYGQLNSTRDAITEVIQLQKERSFTNQFEVETYTWDVLPPELKTNLIDSIARELSWVAKQI